MGSTYNLIVETLFKNTHKTIGDFDNANMQ